MSILRFLSRHLWVLSGLGVGLLLPMPAMAEPMRVSWYGPDLTVTTPQMVKYLAGMDILPLIP
ncbi:MAG: hypothetical protein AAGL17_24305, partial [Cyanobacteria bacterium J06576_12]